MPIPDFQSIMLPLLKFSSDKKEHTVRETEEYLANAFRLTKEEREEMLPSGTTRTFVNRVAWTKAHLMKAGLIMSPRRSVYKITQRGIDVLKEDPVSIDVAYLKRFEEYREFLKPSKDKAELEPGSEIESSVTPRETFENAYQLLRKQVLQEVLEKVKAATPKFFEEIVVELLVKMGYGGSVEDAGKATRFTNDEGIDGIIKEDKLGLDVIYIQKSGLKTQSADPKSRPSSVRWMASMPIRGSS